MSRIGYLLLEPPRYSETFILNELIELRRLGLPHRIFCLSGDEALPAALPESVREVTELLGSEEDVPLSLAGLLDIYEAAPEVVREQLARAARKTAQRGSETRATRRREPFRRLACAARLVERCRTLGIGHLHAHYANSCGEVAAWARRLGGPELSFTGHAKDIFTLKPESLRKLIERARFAIGCSRAGVDHMRRAAPEAADRVHLVHHGLRIEQWPAVEPAWHEQAPPGIVAVGRLTPKKGFPVLIEALSILHGEGRAMPCEIIGEGRERAALEARARDFGLASAVQLPGRLEREVIRDRFQNAPIFVLPSIILESQNQDGLANALLEAMASGLAVVASDIPAFREIIEDGVNGRLVPSGDAAALAQAIAELAGDAPRRVALGRAARERVAGLSCEDAAHRIRDLLEHRHEA